MMMRTGPAPKRFADVESPIALEFRTRYPTARTPRMGRQTPCRVLRQAKLCGRRTPNSGSRG